jgi:predicted lipid-binding transport protein (Tim44 family)
VTRRLLITSALVALLLAAVLPATGCSRDSGPTIVNEEANVEDTSTITPLQRGKERRDALAMLRTAMDAWSDSDLATMQKYFPNVAVDQFKETWADYAAEGLTVKHVHEVTYLDVTEMNRSGTQALVTLSMVDNSYLVERNGKTARDLPVLDKDIQFTLEKDENGDWKIKRMVASVDSYR